MGRSVVKFRERSFEAHNCDQLVWSDYAKRAISELPCAQDWLLRMGERLGVPYSFASILDEHLTQPDRIAQFLSVNERVLRLVESEGESIPLARLEQIDTDFIGWVAPYETRFVIEFSRALEFLILGKYGQKTRPKAGTPD